MEIIKAEEQALCKRAEQALEKCAHAMDVWSHSRSGMMLKNITIGGEYSPLRRMRQVAAELQRKHDAMIEARYKLLKRKKMAEIKRREALEEQDSLKGDYLVLQAEELEAQIGMVERPYLGAMREVVELSRLHDALEAQIREQHNGKFDEEVFELEEAKYWVKRAIAQSMRDIRERGSITAGNQELLEQIGLDPDVIKIMLVEFMNANRMSTDVSSGRLEVFLDNCAQKYHKASSEKIKRIGLPVDIETGHLLTEETADS